MPSNTAIIIPTYNSADMTISLIKELLKQTYQDFDIIVVDDGSEDWKKIKEEFENHERLKRRLKIIVLKENMGPGAAFRAGMMYAMEKGYEILILNDNDSFPIDKDLIKKLVGKIREDKNKVYIPRNILSPYFYKGTRMDAPPQFLTMHIDIVKKCGYPLVSFYIGGEDTEYTMRITQKYGFKLELLEKPVYIHPIDNNFKHHLLTSRTFYAFRNIIPLLSIVTPYFKNTRRKLITFLLYFFRMVSKSFLPFFVKNKGNAFRSFFKFVLTLPKLIVTPHKNSSIDDIKKSEIDNIILNTSSKEDIARFYEFLEIKSRFQNLKNLFVNKKIVLYWFRNIEILHAFLHDSIAIPNDKDEFVIIKSPIRGRLLRILVFFSYVLVISALLLPVFLLSFFISSLMRKKWIEHKAFTIKELRELANIIEL